MSFNSPLKNLSTLQRDGIPQGMKPSGPPVASLLGFMGLPLAFLALPLYVYLPHHDVQTLGLPMAQVGFVFLWLCFVVFCVFGVVCVVPPPLRLRAS